MMRYFGLLLLLVTGCVYQPEDVKMEIQGEKADLELTQTQAEKLAVLPLRCVEQEYPNKLGQVIGDSVDIQRPIDLHPAFYGCFDWHSSVHGHWLMVRLLKKYPNLKSAQRIRKKLSRRLTEANIAQEMAYFNQPLNLSFERTYGWAWLLKLQEELDTFQDSEAQEWANNLRPLANLIRERYMEFLPKLNYPIRSGEHYNTAFGLSFAYDYSVHKNDVALRDTIEQVARKFYQHDHSASFKWEPSGFDFLSPMLCEAELMCKVLPSEEFMPWFEAFIPKVMNHDFSLEVGQVSDRTDGKLVHLDGLNFSRAWCLYEIAHKYPRYGHLRTIADQHLAHSLPSVIDGNYMGEHWLASFATYALIERNGTNEAAH